MPSPDLIVFPCCAERSEPKSGLEPRFEALTQFVKSPNTPGGVMAKAITPLPLRVNTIRSSDWVLKNKLSVLS